MRCKTSRVAGVRSARTKTELLTEGTIRHKFKTEVLDGKEFKIHLEGHGNRNWMLLSDDELVEYAKAYCKEKGITKASELEKGSNKNPALYQAIGKRKLTNTVFERKQFEEVTLDGKTFKIPLDKQGRKNWQMLSNEWIVEYAKAYCAEKKITRPSKLIKGPNRGNGIYDQLQRRGLVNQVFERKEYEELILDGRLFKIPLYDKEKRHWQAMSDSDLIDFTKAYLKNYGISVREKLRIGHNSLGGLYHILLKRNLLDIIFSTINATQDDQVLVEIADALTKF